MNANNRGETLEENEISRWRIIVWIISRNWYWIRLSIMPVSLSKLLPRLCYVCNIDSGWIFIFLYEASISIETRIIRSHSTFPSSLTFLPPTGNVKSLARIDYTTQMSFLTQYLGSMCEGRRKDPTYLNIFFDNIFLSSQYFPSLRIISQKRINK